MKIGSMKKDLWIASVALGAALALTGCPKSNEGGDKPAPSAAGSAAAPDGDAASATAGDAAAQAEAKASSYAGTYTLAPAEYYIPSTKDYASVKRAKDDPTKHVGDGAVTLTVEPDGRVSGTVDSGPASPAVIDGMLVDGEIRGNVRRKDPKDDGLTGTLVAKIAGDAADGSMSLAEANAAVVREGKLSLKKK